MKKLQFVSEAARAEMWALPLEVRKAIGFQLLRLQKGEMPIDFKPIKAIGSGVYEIRVVDDRGANVGRCLYVAKFSETIWVLHSFIKKSAKTPQINIEVGISRYRGLVRRIKSESL
jgi:phage-related protein